MLSSRPDLVPPEYAEEFRKLQDQVAPFSFDEVRRTIEEETGGPVEELFATVEAGVLAAASIAQVHRATLTDGSRVVIKVRRPGIERTVKQDLGVLKLIVDTVEHYVAESRSIGLQTIYEEFSRAIRKELDFFLEGSNTENIRRNFEGHDEVVVPRVHWELTSESLLVMEEIVGVPATDPTAMSAYLDSQRHKMAEALACAYMKMVFEDGVFHADLHAGNIRITPEGKVALLDFGSVGYLTGEMQQSLGNFFLALINRDYQGLADEFLKLGLTDDGINASKFERDLRDLIEPYYGRPLSELRVGEVLRESITIALKHNVSVPAEMVLLGRSSLTIEGMISRLDPTLDILEVSEPFAKRLIARRFDPREQGRFLLKLVSDYRSMAAKLPRQVSKVFERLLASRLSIDFVHQGYDKALEEIDRSSNRIAVSMVISALIVGSALIVQSGKGPVLWDFPLFGIVGFVVAGMLGLGLAIQILRSGKF